jgi:WhiB family transcriptional regulator, redox-sensing transcriptional regulator
VTLTDAMEVEDLETRFVEAMMLSTEPLPDVAELFKRPAWQQQAACRGAGTARFFPAEGSSLMRARRVCARCPVSDECLRYALAHPSLKGIWAGTSERRRRKLRVAAGLPTLPEG